MIYAAIKNGQVVCSSSAELLQELDGAEPEVAYTDKEFLANHEIIRVIDGELFLGLTEEEEENRQKIILANQCRAQLDQVDKEAMAGRAVRELVLQLAENAGLKGKAIDTLRGYEEKANEIRELLPEEEQ
jgi:hypothetical protein